MVGITRNKAMFKPFFAGKVLPADDNTEGFEQAPSWFCLSFEQLHLAIRVSAQDSQQVWPLVCSGSLQLLVLGMFHNLLWCWSPGVSQTLRSRCVARRDSCAT